MLRSKFKKSLAEIKDTNSNFIHRISVKPQDTGEKKIQEIEIPPGQALIDDNYLFSKIKSENTYFTIPY